jgi:hypothetical protein
VSHVIRLMLAALVALIATAAVACGQDTAAPSSTVAPGATLPPEAPAATPLPTERSVAAAASEAPTAATPTSRAAATATPQGVARSVREPENNSLKIISSRSIALPSSSSSSLLRLGGFSSSTGIDSSVNPQTIPTEGGLTVSAIGLVTVAADEAYVVIIPEQVYSSSGLEQMTDEDRQQIRENLAEIGVSEESVEFENLVRYGPSSISVEVALDELDEKKEQILDAVESVIRRYESYGVTYSLTEENCETALSLARREAIPRAERAADDLAEALGVERDGVTGALEYPLGISVYGLSGFDSHSCGAQASTPYPSLVPFDAEPQVEVAVGLQITYGLR